jgi:hypothetical protein
MDTPSWVPVVLLALSLSALANAAEPTLLDAGRAAKAALAQSARFQGTGTVSPQASSADGRFALQAEARFTPASPRFSLRGKSTDLGATCTALGELIFANGFQDPP